MLSLHVTILAPEFLSSRGTANDDSDENKAEQSDVLVNASCWILGVGSVTSYHVDWFGPQV